MFLKVLLSLSLGSVLWLEPLSGLRRRLDGLEFSMRLGLLFWHVGSLGVRFALWTYILLEVIEAGFLCFFKISVMRNFKFRAVIEVLIAFIVRRELCYLFIYEGNTAFKDLRYWLTLSTGSILSLESVKRVIILLNVALKFAKDFS